MNYCCNINANVEAAPCRKINPINVIKSIRITKTDFKERYKMPFSRFIKLIKECPDLEIIMEPVFSSANVGFYQCTIKGGIYSVTFNIL